MATFFREKTLNWASKKTRPVVKTLKRHCRVILKVFLQAEKPGTEVTQQHFLEQNWTNVRNATKSEDDL